MLRSRTWTTSPTRSKRAISVVHLQAVVGGPCRPAPRTTSVYQSSGLPIDVRRQHDQRAARPLRQAEKRPAADALGAVEGRGLWCRRGGRRRRGLRVSGAAAEKGQDGRGDREGMECELRHVGAFSAMSVRTTGDLELPLAALQLPIPCLRHPRPMNREVSSGRRGSGFAGPLAGLAGRTGPRSPVPRQARDVRWTSRARKLGPLGEAPKALQGDSLQPVRRIGPEGHALVEPALVTLHRQPAVEEVEEVRVALAHADRGRRRAQRLRERRGEPVGRGAHDDLRREGRHQRRVGLAGEHRCQMVGVAAHLDRASPSGSGAPPAVPAACRRRRRSSCRAGRDPPATSGARPPPGSRSRGCLRPRSAS
ncbi:MAG: hypothetical protein MZV63_27085 [Marinilabiliales bacterium]|nr:hypothetical protein [Marinilabiliales bacterium]